jgi:hypothetical protein
VCTFERVGGLTSRTTHATTRVALAGVSEGTADHAKRSVAASSAVFISSTAMLDPRASAPLSGLYHAIHDGHEHVTFGVQSHALKVVSASACAKRVPLKPAQSWLTAIASTLLSVGQCWLSCSLSRRSKPRTSGLETIAHAPKWVRASVTESGGHGWSACGPQSAMPCVAVTPISIMSASAQPTIDSVAFAEHDSSGA